MGVLLQIGLHLLGLTLVVLDFALYVVTLGPFKTLYKMATARTVFAKSVSEVYINGKGQAPSKIWRSVEAVSKGKLCTTTAPDVSTLYEGLAKSYKIYANVKASATRPLLRWQKDEGFKFPAKVFGESQWRSFKETGELVHAFGAALRALGLSPQPADASEADHKGILIYDETSADWMICAQGAISQDIVVATAYATLGIDSVIKAVKQGGAKAIVCNRSAVKDVMAQAAEMKSLCAVIYTDTLCTPEECSQKISSTSPNVKVLSLEEALALGKANICPPNPPKPSSIAVIMYTSGSTGDPKGVVITHSTMLSMVAGVEIQLGSHVKPGGNDLYLGYLPLAHILELTAEFYYYMIGNPVAYADPKSLLGGPERAYPHGALEEFKPTLMAGVPKVWESIKAGAQAKVNKAGPVPKFLIGLAIRMKAIAAYQHRSTPLFNVLLKRFKNATGGQLKAGLSGGGAISGEVQEWVRTALDCPLIQGYGLTETCAGATIQMPDDTSIGIAGTPLSCIEITLHSEPEITDSNGEPYLTTDTSHYGVPCAGRGEVWLRGNNITKGYYKLPEQTAADFDQDGFFHTGDIGMLTPGGALKIIDRKKNLVKLKGGEYVALEKMNLAYNNSPFVNVDAGGVCSYAGAELDRSVALAQVKEEELVKVATENGITFNDPSELPKNPKVRDAVLKSFQAEAKKGGLTSLETVVAVYPLLEPWSTLNGCLTATQKIVSKKIYAVNKAELDTIKPVGIRG